VSKESHVSERAVPQFSSANYLRISITTESLAPSAPISNITPLTNLPLNSALMQFYNLRVSEEQMECKYCKSLCVKAGRSKANVQRYRCNSCCKYQLQDYNL